MPPLIRMIPSHCCSFKVLLLSWMSVKCSKIIYIWTAFPNAFTQVVTHQNMSVKLQINTLRLRQNGRHFPDNIFTCIFSNENVWISRKISLTILPKDWINNIPVLIQIMAWRRIGAKPLPEPRWPSSIDAYMSPGLSELMQQRSRRR